MYEFSSLRDSEATILCMTQCNCGLESASGNMVELGSNTIRIKFCRKDARGSLQIIVSNNVSGYENTKTKTTIYHCYCYCYSMSFRSR